MKVLTVDNARVRTTTPGATEAAVYFDITSPIDDTLEGASIEPTIGAAATLHETTTGGGNGAEMGNMPGMDHGEEGDMSTMVDLDRVDLAAGTVVRFEPGGLHLMVEELAAPLVDGDTFVLTLEFAEAGPTAITVEVSDDV